MRSPLRNMMVECINDASAAVGMCSFHVITPTPPYLPVSFSVDWCGKGHIFSPIPHISPEKLLLLEAIGDGDLGGKVRGQVVLHHLCPFVLAPAPGAARGTERRHRHDHQRVRLGEDVHVGQVPGAEERDEVSEEWRSQIRSNKGITGRLIKNTLAIGYVREGK